MGYLITGTPFQVLQSIAIVCLHGPSDGEDMARRESMPAMKVAGGKMGLLLDQIANGRAILLNIQHRIAMVRHRAECY